MRKTAFVGAFCATLLSLCLLLFSCSDKSSGKSFPEEHTHVFGHWYVVIEENCLSPGARVRYCKICHAEEIGTIPVPEDEGARRHDFADTVTAPTENAEGYTERTCTRCGYHIEKTDVRPPLYAVFTDADTAAAPPDGVTVSSFCFFDALSHRALALAGGDDAVNADLARRLAAAKVIADAVRGGELAFSDTLSVDAAFLTALPDGAHVNTEVFYEGAVVSAEQALECWLKNGGGDAGAALARFLDASETELAARATARAGALALTNTAFSSLSGDSAAEHTTLTDTAVLLNCALADDLLSPLLSTLYTTSARICSRTPALWFSSQTLRVSLVKGEEGQAYILLLAGEELPSLAAENAFFGTVFS